MNVNVQGAGVAVAPLAALRDPQRIMRVQRAAIAADLNQINADLRLDILQAQIDRGERLDSKTDLIVDWHRRFSALMVDTEHPQAVYQEFQDLLKEILVDTIFRSALDINCYSGSDGGTYTDMGLQVYRHIAPAEFQRRSPRFPQDEREFVLSPHRCANYMVGWLLRHNVVHRNRQNEVLEEAHRQLNLVANRPQRPQLAAAANQNDVMRQIMERQVRRQQQREQERNAQIEARRVQLEVQRRAEIEPLVQQALAPIRQQVAENHQRQRAQAQNLNEDVGGVVNALQPVIALLQENIHDAQERVQAVDEQHGRIQVQLVVLDCFQQRLHTEAAELRKKIKESERSGSKVFVNALIVIGICVAGNIALKCIMEGTTSTAMTVRPMSGGGFGVGPTYRF
jgi:hypothetical protein